MKTIQKLTAILLSIAILTALFILPAAAEDGADAPAAEAVFTTDAAEKTPIELPKPAVTVTGTEGETVLELTLDFTPEDANAPLLFDRADMSKTIILHVSTEYGHLKIDAFSLQPKAFDAETGVLIVSLLDRKGQVGFPLHDLVFTINGVPESVYTFDLTFPGALLYSSLDENACSAESCCECGSLCDVDGMPIRACDATVAVPSWTGTLYSRITRIIRSEIIKDAVAGAIAFPFFLFGLPVVARTGLELYESFAIYNYVNLSYLHLYGILAGFIRQIS